MTFISGIPSWLVMVLGFMFMGNVMRLVFSRSRFRSRGRWEQLGSGEVDRLEAAINQRDVVIEDLQQRMSELESRLDFTERMISSRSEVS